MQGQPTQSHVRPLLGTLSDLFRMLSPSSVKQIPVRSSLQLQLLSRISQIWLPVDSKSTDPRIPSVCPQRMHVSVERNYCNPLGDTASGKDSMHTNILPQ